MSDWAFADDHPDDSVDETSPGYLLMEPAAEGIDLVKDNEPFLFGRTAPVTPD